MVLSKKGYKVFGGIVILNIFVFLWFLISKQYTIFPILLNIGSLLVLCGWVMFPKIHTKFIRTNRQEIVLCSLLFLIAIALRFYQVTSLPPGFYGDEVTVGQWGLRVLSMPQLLPFLHEYSHPTPLLYLTGWSIGLFGRSVTAIRLPSILFGSGSVVLFYILLRQRVSRFAAFAGGIVLAGFYPHLVISRLSYETAASLFFQILSAIFLFKAYKTKDPRFIIALGLSLGLGLYTYLNFRIFAGVVVLLSCVLFLSQSKRKEAMEQILLLGAAIFVVAMPLLSFGILFPADFWGRTNEVFIFNLHLSTSETIKELLGSTVRSFSIFGYLGDPSPKHNPSGVPFFDFLSVFFIVAGVLALFKQNKKLLLVVILLSLPPFISDIFSLERIPEFHYYGIGHPHGLRISGMIGVGLFLLAIGIGFLKQWGEKKDKYLTNTVLVAGICFVFFLHIYWYFNQQNINPAWYMYNYQVNGAQYLKAGDIIKSSNASTIYLSQDYRQSSQIDFFIDSQKKLVVFAPKNSDAAYTSIKNQQFTLMSLSQQNVLIANDVINRIQKEGLGTQVEVLSDPLGKQEAVIFNNP